MLLIAARYVTWTICESARSTPVATPKAPAIPHFQSPKRNKVCYVRAPGNGKDDSQTLSRQPKHAIIVGLLAFSTLFTPLPSPSISHSLTLSSLISKELLLSRQTLHIRCPTASSLPSKVVVLSGSGAAMMMSIGMEVELLMVQAKCGTTFLRRTALLNDWYYLPWLASTMRLWAIFEWQILRISSTLSATAQIFWLVTSHSLHKRTTVIPSRIPVRILQVNKWPMGSIYWPMYSNGWVTYHSDSITIQDSVVYNTDDVFHWLCFIQAK